MTYNTDYQVPEDVKEVLKTCSIMSKQFSILLLKKRAKGMSDQTYKRSVKTIACLRTQIPFG